RREPWGVELGPDVAAQALGHQEVALSVDAAEHAAVLCRCQRPFSLGEVPEFDEHVCDAVEDRGHSARAGADLAREGIRLALEAPPALGPAGMLLALRASVTRMLLHAPAQIGKLPAPRLPRSGALRACSGTLALEVRQLAAQRRVLGEVAEVALHGTLIPCERFLLLAHR